MPTRTLGHEFLRTHKPADRKRFVLFPSGDWRRRFFYVAVGMFVALCLVGIIEVGRAIVRAVIW